MNSITLHIDWKMKTAILLRGGKGKDTELELDSSDNVELTDEIFKTKDMKSIDKYEYEVAEMLPSEEDQAVFYRMCGTALNIMISRTAGLIGIDKRLAKEIIMQGERRGIFYQANNNTWKLRDGEVRSRWVDKADELSGEEPMKGAPSFEEAQANVQRDREKHGLPQYEGEEGTIAKRVKRGAPSFKSVEEEKTHEIIPEVELSKIDTTEMKQDLKDLKYIRDQMRSRYSSRNSRM